MTEDKIFELLDLATGYDTMSLEKKAVVLDNIEQGWEKLPNDKYTLSESSMLALMMFDEYLKMNNLDFAKKWGDVLINDTNRPDCGEKELITGKLLFESGENDKAKDSFLVAFRKSNGRIFEGEPKKYLDLIKK